MTQDQIQVRKGRMTEKTMMSKDQRLSKERRDVDAFLISLQQVLVGFCTLRWKVHASGSRGPGTLNSLRIAVSSEYRDAPGSIGRSKLACEQQCQHESLISDLAANRPQPKWRSPLLSKQVWQDGFLHTIDEGGVVEDC